MGQAGPGAAEAWTLKSVSGRLESKSNRGSNLHLEWSIVNATLLPLMAFHLLGLVALGLAWRKTGQPG